VGGTLTTEVPTLHGTLITLTLGDGLNIYELPDTEVTGAQVVSNGEEVLWCNQELSQMPLGWQVVLEEVSSLRLLQVFQALLTTSDLDSVAAVFLKSLDLCDLASVDLDNSAWYELTPLVPEMSHSYLVSDQTSPLALTILRGSLLKLVLLVDLILKRHKCFSLVCQAMSVGCGERTVVKDLCLLEVLVTNLMELCNRQFLFLGSSRCEEPDWLCQEDGLLQEHARASSKDSFTYDLRQHI